MEMTAGYGTFGWIGLMGLSSAADFGPVADGPAVLVAVLAAGAWLAAAWGRGERLRADGRCTCRWRRLRLFGMLTAAVTALSLWLQLTCDLEMSRIQIGLLVVLLVLSVGARCRVRHGMHEKQLLSLTFATEAAPPQG